MAHRNRYVKVALFEEVKTHLQDAKVVGQGSDYLLLERPQPKERKVPVTRKPRAKKINQYQPPTLGGGLGA